MTTTYMVRRGGSDTSYTFTDISDAEEFAVEWAMEIAREMGDDPDSVDVYYNTDDNWGACPEGDDGAYYPLIEARKE